MTIGDTTLPGTIIELERRKRRIYLEKMIPGNSLAKRVDRGAFGIDLILRGLLTSDLINNQTTIENLADGTKRVLDLEDGTTSMECLALDPVFRRDERKPNRIFYELPLVQTSYFDSRTLSDSFGGFSELLSYIAGYGRSHQETFGGFSDLLSYVANSYRLQEEFGGFSEVLSWDAVGVRQLAEIFGGFDEALSYLIGYERTLAESFGGFSQSLAGQLSSHWGVTSPGSTSYPTETVDSFSETNRDNHASAWSGQPLVGQAFAMGAAPRRLRQVKFYLAKYGSPTGTCRARLYACSGTPGTSGTGTGSSLADSGTLDVSTISTQPTYTSYTFTFSIPYQLAANTNYVVVLEFTGGDATNNVRVGNDSSSPTHGGNMCFYDTSWSYLADRDTCFYVIGDRLQGYIQGTLATVGRTGAVYAVRFYSHADSSGKTRVALYSNASPKALFWQIGPVDVVAGWNLFLISAGSPTSLNLTLNDIVSLTWQFNDVTNIPSYVLGGSNTGWYKAQAFGAFPANISGETLTTQNWAVYGMTV